MARAQAVTVYGIKNCMLDQPAMIKRPVLDVGSKLLVGFKPEACAKALA